MEVELPPWEAPHEPEERLVRPSALRDRLHGEDRDRAGCRQRRTVAPRGAGWHRSLHGGAVEVTPDPPGRRDPVHRPARPRRRGTRAARPGPRRFRSGDPPAPDGGALRRLARARCRGPGPARRTRRPGARAVTGGPADRWSPPRRHRARRGALGDARRVHSPRREVPPPGVRSCRQAGAAGDRSLRVLRRRGDHPHRDPPRPHPRRPQRRRPRARHGRGGGQGALDLRDRRPAVRVLGRHLPAPQERPRAARRVQPPRPRGRAPSAGARGSARVEARRRRRRGGGRAGGSAPSARSRAPRAAVPAVRRGRPLRVARACTKASASPRSRRWRRRHPVLCSDIPALREVAGDAARFVPASDVDAWVTAFYDLLGRRCRARDLGRRPGPRASRTTRGNDARARRPRCTARRSAGEHVGTRRR